MHNIGSLQRKLLCFASVAVLTACGGGGGGGGGGAADSIAQKSTFTDDDVYHLLHRTRFGITQQDFAAAKKDVPAFVAAMLDITDDVQQFETAARDELIDLQNDPPGQEGMFPSGSDIARWRIQLMLNNPNPFQEAMALFWEDHFGVSSQKVEGSEAYMMEEYVNSLRNNCVGNFRDLFLAVSLSGAMIRFLDTGDNDKFNPNENFAREFWELFSLGVDNGYAHEDIIEGARAFTGFRSEFNPNTQLSQFIYDGAANKNIGIKLPLGIPIADNVASHDFDQMVDITLAHGDNLAAKFICRKLVEYFVMPNPSDALVNSLAAELVAANYELKSVIRKILLSEAFYADAAKLSLVRQPYEMVIGLVRTTGMTEDIDTYLGAMADLASIPTQPPSVSGWPQGKDALNGQRAKDMANFANQLITNRSNQATDGYDAGAVLQPANADNAEDVIIYLAQLLRVQLSAEEIAAIADFMDTDVQNSQDANGNYLEIPSNYTPGNPEHVDRRLRNALYIMTQHPSFFTK